MCAKSASLSSTNLECISKDGWTGARLDGLGRQMPPESARTRYRAEKAEYVTRNSVQPHTAGQFTLDVWHQRHRGLLR